MKQLMKVRNYRFNDVQVMVLKAGVTKLNKAGEKVTVSDIVRDGALKELKRRLEGLNGQGH